MVNPSRNGGPPCSPLGREGQMEHLRKRPPENEKWEGLKKGGTAGIYTVVVALSWWIKAVGNVADGGDAFVAVRDITWVLDQVCESLISERGS